MTTDLSFKQVCDLIKKDDPDLIDLVDKILGLAIICAPLALGPDAFPLLGLLAAKNELTKIGTSVFKKFVGKKDTDFLSHQQRMATAYGLICFTSFFEALDREIPSALRNGLQLLPEEKRRISEKAIRELEAKKPQPRIRGGGRSAPSHPVSISLPHPVETFADQKYRLNDLYNHMTERLLEFFEALAVWDDLKDPEKSTALEALKKLPGVALKCFEAQYFELAAKYPDFGIWANFQKHAETTEFIKTLSNSVQDVIAQRQKAAAVIDVGFANLHEAVLAIPKSIAAARATEVVEGLRRYYQARIDDPIIDDKPDEREEGPRLSFPRIRDAFVPQSYRVIRQTTKTRRLESEDTWEDAPIQHDLGVFILSYLSSPFSLETPLVILGHPGSGKSLLTQVLSATLLSDQFTPLRVPLREVDSDLPIANQVEHCVAEATKERIDSWARLSAELKDRPPVIILDGYDELLQISGKVYSAYLNQVRNFRFVRKTRGLIRARAICQVSDRARVRGNGTCETRRIFS